MAFVIISEPSPRQAVETILRRITYVLIPYSVLLIKYYPYYGREYGRWGGELSWIGVTLQKNGLGRLCLIAVLYLLWSLGTRWRRKKVQYFRYQTYVELLLLATTIWLMRGPSGSAYSATALVSSAVAILVYFGLQTLKNTGSNSISNIIPFFIIIVILIGIVSVFTSGSAVGSFSSYLGRDRTLTERTSIWKLLVPVAMQKPIFGGGFGGIYISTTRETYRLGDFVFSEAHNGYLDVLLALGFTGIILVTFFLLSSCRKARRVLSYDYEWGSLWICILVAALVHNISESSIHSFQTQLTAVLLFFSVSSSNTYSHSGETVMHDPRITVDPLTKAKS